MSRLMSVAYTEQAVVERRKTVTRRLGWLFAKPGDTVTLCRKVMGRKPGEPLVRLAEVEIVDVRRQPLTAITADDIARECVPVEVFTPEIVPGSPRPHEMACADCRRANWIGWFARTMHAGPDKLALVPPRPRARRHPTFPRASPSVPAPRSQTT